MSDDEIRDLLDGPSATDIDKSWAGAFPLVGSIAGTGDMLSDDVMPVGPDLGFGPAMLVDEAVTQTIAEAVSNVDDEAVEEAWFNLDSPLIELGNFHDPEEKEFAMGGYEATVKVFIEAAKLSQGVLFAIT